MSKKNNTQKIDYKKSGVNIDEGNRFVSLIKSEVESTKINGVLGGIGGFAGLFSLSSFKDMEEPVLVSGTDGVGTKLKVALMSEKYNTVGIDLVAMSVNDLLVTGAKPLFFLDYVAVGKLIPENMKDIVLGVVAGCKESGCALLGGETAEMPGLYIDNDFDLAGFAVGIVDKKKIIDGSTIKSGDVIIGVASSGFHSNGYSLLRNILFNDMGYKANDIFYDDVTVADALLIPTKIYAKIVENVTKNVNVKGMVHITGGGFYDNIPRVLPKNISAKIDILNVDMPKSIKRFVEVSNIDKHELYRVFNMGVGYIFVVSKEDRDKVISVIEELNEKAYIIGETINGDNSVKIKGIDFD